LDIQNQFRSNALLKMKAVYTSAHQKVSYTTSRQEDGWKLNSIIQNPADRLAGGGYVASRQFASHAPMPQQEVAACIQSKASIKG